MDDEAAIAAIVSTFFAAFTSGPDAPRRLDALRGTLLADAVVVRIGEVEPTVYDVDGFLEPRRQLLTDGTLTDFREWEESGRTEVWGDIAQHACTYAKAGVQGGVAFTGRGRKIIQLVRTSAGWRISAAAWEDERPGSAETAPDAAGDVAAAARARAHALADGDADALMALLDERFSWTTHTGQILDRETYVGRNTDGSTIWRSQELDEVQVVVEGTTAVLRAVATDVVTVDDGPQEFRMPMTQVWVLSSAGWRCLAGHAGPRLQA